MKLENNPFYILNVGLQADRTTINTAVDELSFLDEDGSVERARQALLNPAKRLSAEMDWFPGVGREDIHSIRQSIETKTRINLSGGRSQ